MSTTTVNICYAILELGDTKHVSPVSLRGYVSHLFTNIPEFHHHSEKSYHYPLVQYKVVDHHPTVVGLNEYAPIVYEKISQLEHLVTADEKLRISNIQMKSVVHKIAVGTYHYQFISPWLALNQDNYSKWKESDRTTRNKILNKILLGNILSMLKGLGIFVDYQVIVQLLRFKTKKSVAHDNTFVGISADFSCNLDLPQFLGLGKSVSKGFGVIRKEI